MRKRLLAAMFASLLALGAVACEAEEFGDPLEGDDSFQDDGFDDDGLDDDGFNDDDDSLDS